MFERLRGEVCCGRSSIAPGGWETRSDTVTLRLSPIGAILTCCSCTENDKALRAANHYLTQMKSPGNIPLKIEVLPVVLFLGFSNWGRKGGLYLAGGGRDSDGTKVIMAGALQLSYHVTFLQHLEHHCLLGQSVLLENLHV